jgi:predicted NAD/FAD-binding protein
MDTEWIELLVTSNSYTKENMSKISVVGGGITGLAAAYLAAKIPVNIFEASKNMGGILKDYNFDGYNFFSGCHYFNGDSMWSDRMGLNKFLPV